LRTICFIFIFLCFIPAILIAQDTITKKELRKQKRSFLLVDRPWTVEIPLWIPGFSGSFAHGDIYVEGEDGQEIENPVEPPPSFDFGKLFKRLFSKEWYLKFYYLTRVAYEKNRWLGQFDVFGGSVGESTEFNYNNEKIVEIDIRTINARLFGGYKFVNVWGKNKKFRYELFGYIGVRAHFHRIYSELDRIDKKLDFTPNWIEPILGLQNQFTWKRWLVVFMVDNGGFFIDNKYSFQASTSVSFRSGKLTSVKLGWNHLYIYQKGSFRNENYKVIATLSGPAAGIAFHF